MTRYTCFLHVAFAATEFETTWSAVIIDEVHHMHIKCVCSFAIGGCKWNVYPWSSSWDQSIIHEWMKFVVTSDFFLFLRFRLFLQWEDDQWRGLTRVFRQSQVLPLQIWSDDLGYRAIRNYPMGRRELDIISEGKRKNTWYQFLLTETETNEEMPIREIDSILCPLSHIHELRMSYLPEKSVIWWLVFHMKHWKVAAGITIFRGVERQLDGSA
jgi:hypothetical protein